MLSGRQLLVIAFDLRIRHGVNLPVADLDRVSSRLAPPAVGKAPIALRYGRDFRVDAASGGEVANRGKRLADWRFRIRLDWRAIDHIR
jgi:hypothetical protein